MITLQQWLDAYGDSHRNPTNIAIHKICVPAIVFTVLGFAWCIPVPAALAAVPFANFASLIVLLGLLFYLRLSLSMALGMGLMCGAFLLILQAMSTAGLPILAISAVVFVVAWIGQFYGHKVEGKKPSFFRDLQFLLIGPAWTLSWLYRRLNIPY
ncbi:Mpo1 family 2-hydroxy fatty acid dioxygenase [Chitinimonas lacunae]|uniref:DUF962 domain-containing protein n=1 Tax=Chitinimonas lacunae TaxID=1963018 RepID=A0ABV8MST0_9NEIS